MSYEKIARIVNALSNQTNEQKIKWKQTDTDKAFSVSFPQYSVFIAIEDTEDDFGRTYPDYVIKIINENGEIVEEVSSSDLHNHLSNSWDVMKNMYEMARRQAMGVEEALDSILGIIDPDIPF